MGLSFVWARNTAVTAVIRTSSINIVQSVVSSSKMMVNMRSLHKPSWIVFVIVLSVSIRVRMDLG